MMSGILADNKLYSLFSPKKKKEGLAGGHQG